MTRREVALLVLAVLLIASGGIVLAVGPGVAGLVLMGLGFAALVFVRNAIPF